MATFPFEFIVMWVRPSSGRHEECLFCRGAVTHELHQYVESPLTGHVDMDAAWRQAIIAQMSGNYEAAYYQPVCDECTLRFAAIQLGKRRPIQEMLPMLALVKKQRGIDLSLVICCTVKSVDDEGDLWVIAAPNTTIADVVKHIQSRRQS